MGSYNPQNDQILLGIFSSRLKERRKEYNKERQGTDKLTQQRLAEQLGVSHDAVKSWEKGEYLPTLPHLLEICILLNCDADYLLGLSEEPLHDAFDMKRDTGFSDKTCFQLHNLQNVITNYQGETAHYGLREAFDSLVSNDLFYSFLSEFYAYAITSIRYLESSIRERNTYPRNHRYERLVFHLDPLNGQEDVDFATIYAGDAAKAHVFNALEIMKTIMEEAGAFNSPQLTEYFEKLYGNNNGTTEKPLRINRTEQPYYLHPVRITPDDLEAEFRLMLEAVKSTPGRINKKLTPEQTAFLEREFNGMLEKLTILNTYDPQQAEEAGHRMVMLLVRMDMHRVSFIREPSERIAAALRKSVQELMQLPANERGRM